MTRLTDRYTAAVDYARIAHAKQLHKGTQIFCARGVAPVLASVVQGMQPLG